MKESRLVLLACESGVFPSELRKFLYAKIEQARAREAVEPAKADAVLPVVHGDG